MTTAVIVGAARTPIGSFMGSLASLPSVALGSLAINGALKKTGVAARDVDETIMGMVLQGGVGQAPARQAALGAGLPPHVMCTTVNKVCGSGLKAVMMAAQAIALGDARVVVAGGMESMSNAPYVLKNARLGFRMGNQEAIDMMIHDGLFDPYQKAHMGTFGDICAAKFAFSREAQDEYAKKSYEKALICEKSGAFADEIVPVTVSAKGEHHVVQQDEEPSRFNPGKFASLKPAFSPSGSVTAANASKISDGAAALVMMSESEAISRKETIMARIVGYAGAALEPQWFTVAPSKAIAAVLKRCSLTLDDIDLFEINEAFSVVAMAAIKELGLDENKVNVCGGAVALGHPIGCSGARVLVTLLYALQKRNLRRGLATLCLGGGEAVAVVIERERMER